MHRRTAARGGPSRSTRARPDEHRVAPRRGERHREEAQGGIIHHLEPGKLPPALAGAIRPQRTVEHGAHGRTVPDTHWNAHGGARDLQFGQAQDLACLPDHLHLLPRPPIVFESIDLRHDVVGRGGRRARSGGGTIETRTGLSLEHCERLRAGTRNGLIRRDVEAQKSRLPTQRGEHHRDRDRRTVRVRDQRGPLAQRIRIDLRNDEWHIVAIAERAAVVDHARARGARHRLPALRQRVRAGEQREVHAGERGIGDLVDATLGAAERHRTAGGAFAGERTQPVEGKATLLEQRDHGAPDQAGGAEHCDGAAHAPLPVVRVTARTPTGRIKRSLRGQRWKSLRRKHSRSGRRAVSKPVRRGASARRARTAAPRSRRRSRASPRSG